MKGDIKYGNKAREFFARQGSSLPTTRKIDSVNLEKSLVEKNFQKKINRKEL